MPRPPGTLLLPPLIKISNGSRLADMFIFHHLFPGRVCVWLCACVCVCACVCACVCERVKCQTAASNLAPPVQQPVAPPHGATGGRLGSSNRAAEGSSCFSSKRIETFSRSLNKTTCSHQRGWKFLKQDHPFLNSFLLSLQMTGN